MSGIRAISTAQIKALRGLKERGDQPARRTANVLFRRGFVTFEGEGEGNAVLTARGERWITEYVERTGDGPEDLKAMFRF